MRSQHMAMAIEEFHLLPRVPGWKYEYWDGQAHITPGHLIVRASAEVVPRSVEAPCPIRGVVAADEPGLTRAFLEAFQGSVEYGGWPAKRVVEEARENVRTF